MAWHDISIPIMPRFSVPSDFKVLKYTKRWPEEFQQSNQGKLYCKLCYVLVRTDKAFFVNQHRMTSGHKWRNGNTTPKTQSFINESSRTVHKELAEMFLSIGVPLWKIKNEKVQQFFAKNFNFYLLSHESYRGFVREIYEEKMREVR